MDPKPNENPDPQAEIIPELPLMDDQATDIKGGKFIDGKSPIISDKTCPGSHIRDVII